MSDRSNLKYNSPASDTIHLEVATLHTDFWSISLESFILTAILSHLEQDCHRL